VNGREKLHRRSTIVTQQYQASVYSTSKATFHSTYVTFQRSHRAWSKTAQVVRPMELLHHAQLDVVIGYLIIIIIILLLQVMH